MTRKIITIYNDLRAKTSVSCLLPALQEAFSDETVQTADTAGFLREIGSGHSDVAVIPGICGEDSKYFDLLGGEKGQRALQEFVQNGGILVSVCAGSYLIAKDTQYAPPWGPEKTRTNYCALFNAAARGPLVHEGQKPGDEHWYDDCSIINISYKESDGSWQDTGIVYGNGPALFPYGEEPGMEVLARYSDMPDAPIAAAWKTMGKGAVLWLGVLPYIGHQPVSEDPAYRRAYELMEELKPHDEGRRAFWDTLVERIRNYTPGPAPTPGFSPEGPS